MTSTQAFKASLRNLAAGVTVITTNLEGRYYGLTVTSFTSLSLDPMLVQFALDAESRTLAAITRKKAFCANLLAADQGRVAQIFTRKDLDRFAQVEVEEGENGSPIITGCIGWIECNVSELLERGDHTIIIGSPSSAGSRQGHPLVYFDGSYRALDETEAR